MIISQGRFFVATNVHEFPQFPFVFPENAMYCEKCFKFITFHQSNFFIFSVKAVRNNSEISTDRNKFAQTMLSHDTINGFHL